MKPDSRLSNIDLLRVLSMFLILLTHCIQYGTVWCAYEGVNMDSLWAITDWAVMYWGFFLASVGVNCFVLISGFLLAERTDYRWKSAARTWLSTFFYSFFICLLFVLLGKASARELFHYAFPVYSDVYWFITQFIGLTVLSPFLARLVVTLSKREYQIMLVVLAVMNLRLFKFPYGTVYGGPQTIVWFVFLFFVGAYVKKYRPFGSFRHFGKCYVAFGILLASAYMAIQVALYFKDGKPFDYGNTFNNSFTFLTAFLLFMWAVNHTVREKSVPAFISKAAPLALGVYLITEHPLVRYLLWNEWCSFSAHRGSPWLIPTQLVTCAGVFLLCLGIEWLRTKLFEVLKVDEGVNKLFKHS